MDAPSLDSDIHFLKEKIKNGAEYIITQMFFDNLKFFAFVEKCRKGLITVSIISGLKPIATKKQLNLILHRFSVDFLFFCRHFSKNSLYIFIFGI
jgi:methylenetetrahydrofolate reductase (NADPH)